MCALGVAAYRSALKTGSITGEVPDCVVQLGLLREGAHSADGLIPVPPDVALFGLTQPIERSILNSQHQLASLRVEASRMESVYMEALHEEGEGETVRRLTGADVISAALEQAVNSCTTELLTMQPGGGRSEALLTEAIARDRELGARGVRQRTLYQHSVRQHDATLAYIEQVTAVGAEIRTVDELFDRVIVCDRKIAFIPGVEKRSTSALAIRNPGIVQHLVKAFEYVWSGAEPVAMNPRILRPDSLGEAIHQSVLRLLVTGHPDKVIANRLGISVRSVANHVKRASEAQGSKSRAELGYSLALQGMRVER
ncbi:LuxR C-terminal-related transcriptional regulator [Streptomyces sp. NBC_00102]|uniref:LuxR C-terminal-related transcriptional regulator n=1 Tax=Streptomyces sp. NBC_00102 TaxID=2975652 RepID=UPI00224FED51|nr:LuxR C-terminal-related transcriptional regulator [Streptomyces sp. NBC_00102]MCX5398301.1 LuxR C-terminal-related transcriptional regulator [Streptomyces sp. NBC_00102]